MPTAGLTKATVTATRQTWLGLGRYATQFAAPLLIAAIARLAGPGRPAVPGAGRPVRRSPRAASGRWGRRAALASLLLGPPLTAWAEGRRTLDPARFTLGRIADDIAYGLGVWSGCVTARTLAPLTPVIAWRPLRIDQAARPATHEKEPS